MLVNGFAVHQPGDDRRAGSFVPTYDFGFWKPAAIGDRVWIDGNHNGIQDAGEPGVPGVGVQLKDAAGATIGHTVTDANGLYLFDRLPAGHLQRLLRGRARSRRATSSRTKDAPGATRANGSDAGANGCTASTTLSPGQRDLDWDAGIWKTPPPPRRLRPAAPRPPLPASRSWR